MLGDLPGPRFQLQTWPWVKTYGAIFGWMNIHLPSILMFTNGTTVLTHGHLSQWSWGTWSRIGAPCRSWRWCPRTRWSQKVRPNLGGWAFGKFIWWLMGMYICTYRYIMFILCLSCVYVYLYLNAHLPLISKNNPISLFNLEDCFKRVTLQFTPENEVYMYIRCA